MASYHNTPTKWNIDDSYENQRIDYFLKKKIPSLSFPSICMLLRKGAVKLNDKKVKNNHLLKKGDSIKCNFSINLPKESEFALDEYTKRSTEQLVIHTENDYFIINKPPDLAVQGGTKINKNLDSMLYALNDKSNVKPRLVHRLDKKTSGILIIARNLESAKFFGNLFKTRTIEKTYLAVVEGITEKKSGIIDSPIYYNNKQYEAKTKYLLLKSFNNQSLLILKPITGRKHQIRRHLAQIGCPVIGDDKYNEYLHNRKSLKKLFLHSYSIDFEDKNNKRKIFIAKPPEYFIEILNLLEFKNFMDIKKEINF
jgi:23S rRNA pseudouridine955/2504/2580 synthase